MSNNSSKQDQTPVDKTQDAAGGVRDTTMDQAKSAVLRQDESGNKFPVNTIGAVGGG